MRWTRQRFARDGIAGRVGERPVSDQQRADERCCSVRRSRVVLTPRRWRQVRGVKSAQPGLDKTHPLMTVAKELGHRGELEGNRKNHCVRERRVIPGYSLLLVCVLPLPSAYEAAGATGIRRSPRPLWAEDSSTPRAHGVARANACLGVIASAAKQSMLSFWRDGLLRCARNDGFLGKWSGPQNAPVMPGLDPGIHQSS